MHLAQQINPETTKQTGQPIYARSRDASEIWVCLVEKAYAKLHG